MIASFLALWMVAAEAEDCFTVEKQIQGESLQGRIMPGQTVDVYSPDCMPPKRFDYIVFHTDASDNLVIKQIWGMPGDILTIADDGGVFINGRQALTPFDKPYTLKGYFKKKLKALEGPLNGYLALGHPGSLDSGRVGPIATADIVGVVKKDEGRAAPLPD